MLAAAFSSGSTRSTEATRAPGTGLARRAAFDRSCSRGLFLVDGARGQRIGQTLAGHTKRRWALAPRRELRLCSSGSNWLSGLSLSKRVHCLTLESRISRLLAGDAVPGRCSLVRPWSAHMHPGSRTRRELRSSPGSRRHGRTTVPRWDPGQRRECTACSGPCVGNPISQDLAMSLPPARTRSEQHPGLGVRRRRGPGQAVPHQTTTH